jgi:hypothetical protein
MLLLLLLQGELGMARGLFKTLPDMIEREWKSHEISAGAILAGSHFSLSIQDRHDLIRRHLHGRGLHPLLNLIAKPTDFDEKPAGKFSNDLGLTVREYGVRAGAFDVCKGTIRTVDSLRGSSHVLGLLPSVDAVYPTNLDSWPPAEEAALKVRQAMREEHSSGEISLIAMSRCLFPLAGELIPTWKVRARVDHTPYEIYVNGDEIVEGFSLAFDATAKVKAYHSNPKHPDPAKQALVEFNVEVSGDGTLTNNYFTTGFGDATVRNTAPFDADQSNARHFAEQSSFAHVNRQFQFVSQFGYVWKGPKPIRVLTSFSGAGQGNAQYLPFDGESGPFIIIGPDYPGMLTNIAIDSDVVSHEFGHHVVFSSVTDVPKGSESIVVHEGLADALTFYASGDNCLAESICPTTTPNPASLEPCFSPKKCLRTADNSMKYLDPSYMSNSTKAHIRGQVISGLFADLKRGGAIPSDNLNKLLVATVAYLPRQGTVKSVVVALLDADYALFGQQYSSIIKSAASSRAMGVEELGINLAEVDGQAPVGQSSKKKSSGDGFLGLCSIGAERQNMSSAIFIMMLLLAPLVASLRPRARPQVVRIRNKSK